MNKEQIILDESFYYEKCSKKELAIKLVVNQKLVRKLEQESKELQEQYCERTDCVGRLGEGKNHKLNMLEQENERLKNGIEEVIKIYKKIFFEDYDTYEYQCKNIINDLQNILKGNDDNED